MKPFFSLLVALLALAGGRADARAIRDEANSAGRAANAAVLKDSYQSFFLMGNVVSPRDLGGPRFELLQKHFDILTAENAMKPLYLQREKGVFTFEAADSLVNAALEAGLKMHGHTLAWHQQSPEWINREGISRDEAIDNLIDHAKTVAGHFKGRVVSWDVLNEAIVDNPANPSDWKASLRQTPWHRAIGPEYIEIAFRAARKADPEAVLYYNDYNMDNQNKALAVYNMIKELNEQFPRVMGRPLIDAVGMQGHYRANTSVENVAMSLDRFISLGIEVSITELDIQAGQNSSLSEEQAIQQGMAYARLFSLFRDYACSLGRVTIWGLDDGTSWRAQTNPTLFDRNLREKPAFFAVLNPAAFIAENEGRLAALKKEPLRSDALYGSPSLDAADPLWETSPEIPVNQNVFAWQGAYGTAKVLWDERYLYVRVAVHNAELNKANPSPHEQDSVEIFIDEGNHKATYMQADDGQFRVNFDNEQSFSPDSLAAGFESAAAVSGSSYTVTAKIPFRTIEPRENMLIGFDLQINGASARGARHSIAVWNDTSGNAWQDPSLYGLLRLAK
ncbi:MAG: endo-1,4-beta-xylanase [Treponema sp.]|jgi:endo-1,4-beta-xylanase|nr:endo-1,4-beta-xylanase [Treponema sp.]